MAATSILPAAFVCGADQFCLRGGFRRANWHGGGADNRAELAREGIVSPADVARIKADPRFRELERKRGVFSWTLCIVMFVVYLAYIFLVAFGGPIAATPVWGVVTLAFPAGLAVIILAIVLTGVYVIKANGEYDALNRALVSSMANRSAPGRRMAA